MLNAARPRILLTNDDSHDSPLFHLAIDALSQLGDVSIAVPAAEQSWKGKSMTRYGAIYIEDIDIHGHPAWSVSGTPADCANIAIHNLLDQRPDIIVSGINIGKNIGLGFVFASGTVGACIEGNIAGIPGLALSQELTREDFLHWDKHRAFREETTAILQQRVRELVPLVWHEFIEGHLDQATTWNINFPFAAAATPDIVRTRLGHTFYGKCFQQRGDQYHFGLAEAIIDDAPDTDNQTLDNGHVSATLLDISSYGQQIP